MTPSQLAALAKFLGYIRITYEPAFGGPYYGWSDENSCDEIGSDADLLLALLEKAAEQVEVSETPYESLLDEMTDALKCALLVGERPLEAVASAIVALEGK